MTLAELRKKYVGKRVSDSYMNKHSISIDSDVGDYQYFAVVTIDDDRKITHISRMTGQRLVGDDATHVNYEDIRVSADDYGYIDYEIESLLDPDEVVEEEIETIGYASPRTDEEQLREEVKQLEILVNIARHGYIQPDMSFNKTRIKELMQKIADNEHRFFKIVEEYDKESFRYLLVLKEITQD